MALVFGGVDQYAILVKGIIGNLHAKLFSIWISEPNVI